MNSRRLLLLLAGATALAAAAFQTSSISAPETVPIAENATMSNPRPNTSFLDRPEGRLAYDDIGQGPLVVMVPGLGDLRAEYRFLAPRIAEAGYRVVTLDLRGHGDSSVGWSDYSSAAIGSDVVALVEELDAGPAVLVGTSMGAAAVAWAAAEAPRSVERIALIGPFVRDIPPESALKALAQKLMIRAGLAGPWAPAMWGKAYRSFHASLPDDFEAYRAALVANMKQEGRLDALKGMIFASKADVAARLSEVEAPVLVVMGTADPDFSDPGAEARTVARLLNGTVSMVEGAGHYPHVESPGTVSAALLRFMRGPEGA